MGERQKARFCGSADGAVTTPIMPVSVGCVGKARSGVAKTRANNRSGPSVSPAKRDELIPLSYEPQPLRASASIIIPSSGETLAR
jgi:hypothetical protein